MLNSKQRNKRVKWAKKYLEKGIEFWKRILFSDESSFCIPIGEHGKVWRRKGEKFRPGRTKLTVKHPASVMIWGSMSSEGLGNLIFMKDRINSLVYQSILEDGLLNSTQNINTSGNMIFQQDLAPAHNSKSTRTWLENHNIEVLEWPANSPDLNPIENVWYFIKKSISKCEEPPRTKEQLKTLITKFWSKFSSLKCKELIESMPQHCEAVLRSKGFPTKY